MKSTIRKNKKTKKDLLLLASMVIVPLIGVSWHIKAHPLVLCLCIAITAGLATLWMIPRVTSSFIEVGLSGVDLNKPGKPLLAEAVGVISAMAYLVASFLFIPVLFNKWSQETIQTQYNLPYMKIGEYLSALLSVQSMVLLGFADDVLNLKWRFKLILPTLASIPVLMVYYVSYGVTHVIVPLPLRFLLGEHIDLKFGYYVYIGMMAVFCTNSINILAGVNGIEVGQSVIISTSVILYNILHIVYGTKPKDANMGSELEEGYPNHYFHSLSLCLMVPFLMVVLALYQYNKYPARVFVGDTFCYFAGMTFAVAGILGHFSKTLMLFFIPQVLNFLYSLPQLARIVQCPRHRLPKFSAYIENSESGKSNSEKEYDKCEEYDECDEDIDDNNNHKEGSVDKKVRKNVTKNAEGGGSGKGDKKEHWEKIEPKEVMVDTKNNILAKIRSSKHRKREKIEGVLIPSRADITQISNAGLKMVELLEKIRMIRIYRDADGKPTHVNNMTLINLILVWRGPMSEKKLAETILLIQVISCVLGLGLRFSLSFLFYESMFKHN